MEGTNLGAFFFTVLTATVIALPVTYWLLNRYISAVRLLMKTDSDDNVYVVDEYERSLAVEISYDINYFQTDAKRSPTLVGKELLAKNLTGVFIHAAGIGIYALILSAMYILIGGEELSFARVFMVAILMFWPFFLVLPFLSGLRRSKWLIMMSVYIGCYLMMGYYFMADSPIRNLIVLFLVLNLLPTIMVAILLTPRLRAGGVMVLALTTLTIGGAVGGSLILLSDASMNSAVLFFHSFGIKNAGLIMSLVVVGGIGVGLALAFVVLRLYKQWYLKGTMSDISIVVDSVILYFNVWIGLLLSGSSVAGALLSFTAFIAYKATTYRLLKAGFSSAASMDDTHRLLLLRVFNQQGKADHIFRSLSRFWRLKGTVQMISGRDLLHCTIEPHELMDFMIGRIDRQFLSGPDQVDSSITALSHSPASDGKHPVNEIFCYKNVWKYAVVRLLERTSKVVMDLRSYGPQRKGCEYEIKTLLKIVPASKVLFIIDAHTDKLFFEDTIGQACKEIPVGSPNHIAPQPLPITCFLFGNERLSAGELAHLLS